MPPRLWSAELPDWLRFAFLEKRHTTLRETYANKDYTENAIRSAACSLIKTKLDQTAIPGETYKIKKSHRMISYQSGSRSGHRCSTHATVH